MEIPLQGFIHWNAPAQWVLEPKLREATIASLLEKFMVEWGYDQKPLGWVRNPQKDNHHPYFDPITDWIVAPYRRGFLLVIERKYKDLFGPHAVRLMYKPWQIDSSMVWIAICQIKAMWHSNEKVLASLQETINAGELYQSDRTAETLVYV